MAIRIPIDLDEKLVGTVTVSVKISGDVARLAQKMGYDEQILENLRNIKEKEIARTVSDSLGVADSVSEED